MQSVRRALRRKVNASRSGDGTTKLSFLGLWSDVTAGIQVESQKSITPERAASDDWVRTSFTIFGRETAQRLVGYDDNADKRIEPGLTRGSKATERRDLGFVCFCD